MAAIGTGVNMLGKFLSKPKKINPNTIYDMMSSPHNKEMYQRSQDMIDPNSSLMQGQYDALKEQGADSLYATNRLTRQNMAASGMGGQSGIANMLQQDASLDSGAALSKAYQQMLNQNIGASNQMLSAVTANDMQARQGMASAYGQNINNRNNWAGGMANAFTSMGGGQQIAQLAGMVLCDESMKENIKKIGNAKAKDGKTVGIYEFNYKGRDKKNVGVIAQKVERTHPQLVKTGKNGKKYVAMGGLF